jgi:hypothetical protein
MIDNAVILLSTALVLYVTWRALRLNATVPWFQGPSRPEATAAEPTARRPGLPPAARTSSRERQRRR